MENLIVNNYMLKKELSRFDNGTVLYLAEDVSKGNQYFIKAFKGVVEGDADRLRDSFYAEAKILAHLNHRNILQAIDFFEEAGTFYLVQEHFTAYRLDDIIKHHGASKVLPTLHVIKQVLKALAFAHNRGVIHRGVTATNVYVAKNGLVKLDGFGAASQIPIETGKLFAATAHMSPEQIVNPKAIDHRSDIYSVGMLGYLMLAGQPPRPAGSTIIELMRQMEEDVPDIKEKVSGLDKEMAGIIHRALSKSPDHRFQNCEDFIAALERYQHREKQARADVAHKAEQKRQRRKTIATAISAAATSVVLALTLWHFFFAERIETVLRLQGSNTIGAKLAPALAEEFLKKKGALSIRRERGADEEDVRLIASMGRTRAWAVEIRSKGSSTAFEGFLNGQCDIGMSSRPIKVEEADKLAGLGDLTQYSCEHIIGLDGLAVIVNPANPVTTASKDTIARIFSGEMNQWKGLAGSDKPISIYARDDKSGTFDTFKTIVLEKRKLDEKAKRYGDSSHLAADVANDPNGIGFIGLAYAKSGKTLAISASDADGPIYPNAFTVSREEYPLSRRLYMYIPPKTRNALAREFIEFALSDEGQEIVEKTGFISLAVRAEKVPLVENTPADFRKFLEDAERLSLAFRFRPDTISFDNRSRRDLDRMVHSLERSLLQGRKVMLFGFSDMSEGKKSKEISEQWTKLVAGELAARGIKPSVAMGMGSIMQLAPGGTKEGTVRNNRVEVWLSRK